LFSRDDWSTHLKVSLLKILIVPKEKVALWMLNNLAKILNVPSYGEI